MHLSRRLVQRALGSALCAVAGAMIGVPAVAQASRIVAGVEETGDKRNFYVAENEVLSKASEPTFGGTLVDADGTQYEGCEVLDEWTYRCDYASRLHVSRQHYEAGHWVLQHSLVLA